MKKAFAMWGWITGRIDWNPHTAGWPSLSFYLHLLVQHLHFVVGQWIGAFHDRGDYFVAYWLDPTPLVLISRAVSVVAAARVAGRLAGRAATILVGILLALAPMLVEQSQLVTPDILATMFAALAVDRIVSIASRDQRRDDLWAGLWIGLGVSSKYTPILLVPGLLAAYGLRMRGNAWRSPRPWTALAVALAAFVVTSPFLLLDSEARGRDVANQVLHLTAGHLGGDGGGGLVGYFTRVLGPGLGWGGLVLSVLGLAWGAFRAGSPYRALILCIAPYYLALALLRTQFPRYVLPLLPPLAIGMSGVVAWVRATTHSGRAQAAAIALAAVLAWTPAISGSWRYQQRQSLPSTQSLADQFMRKAQRGEPVYVAAEVLSLSLPTSRSAALALSAATLSPEQQKRMATQPTYDIDYIPMYPVQPEEADRYYDIRHFTAHDYVVVTDAVRARYMADTVRFAAEARFYRDLDHFTELAARFPSGLETRGAEVRVYKMPEDLMARIERERGVLALPPLQPSERIHPQGYLEFMEGMARAALSRGEWARAARYYGAMLQAGEMGWMSEAERLPLIRSLAILEERSGAREAAIRHYRAYLERVPADTAVRSELTRLGATPAGPDAR
jgi:hypothetical protein